jgi:hypothetical protein
MNEWLFVLTPIIILLIVSHLGGLCEPFGGTDSPTQDFPTAATGIMGLVAFWKLDEITGTVAADSQGKDATHANGANPGVYKTSPALFYNGGDKSAAAPGTFTPNGQALTANGGGPAVSFNGGYVEVLFKAALNPANSPGFSIALGVSPGWDPDPTKPVFRVVLESGQVVGATSTVGFILRSNTGDKWEFAVGNGTAADALATGPAVTSKNATNFLVATYDGPTGKMSLYVDGDDPTVSYAAPAYKPNTKFPLRIAMGGGRVTGASTEPARDFPFNGRISGVLIYNRPITADEAKTLAQAFLMTQ